jgi:hypothetical protein
MEKWAGRRVSFASQPIEHHTIARNDFSPEEIKATWFTEEEYYTISRQCCKQIDKMDKGQKLKDKKYCARGLEALTKLASIAKSKSREESIRAVLQEQDMQVEEERYDDEAIGKAYHQVTSSCQMWASVVGLRDQRSSEAYLEDLDVSMLQTIPSNSEHLSTSEHRKRMAHPSRPLAGRFKFTVLARSA